MLIELLTQLKANFFSKRAFSLGTTRVNPNSGDHAIISSGLFLWSCLLSEVACSILSESEFSTFKGRILKQSTVWGRDVDLETFLQTLDDLHDIVLSTISQDGYTFKGYALLKKMSTADSTSTIWPVMAQVVGRLITASPQEDPSIYLGTIYQLVSLLRKLQIDRSDLKSKMALEFIAKEKSLALEEEFQQRRYASYVDLVHRMRCILWPLICDFEATHLRPKHGPGAVANPLAKTARLKYETAAFDQRIDYMLRKSGSAPYEAYLRYSQKSSRTSRFICVPKTWKSLRGISAEPTELQYFQQGLLDKFDSLISRHFRGVIDLHDQTLSQQMTVTASITGSYATIDLSEASDSVTVQLVKDIFGNSLLCRWLLATRSTNTDVFGELVKIRRFAPMGSAVCFPVECLIFTAMALAVVRTNNLHRSWKRTDVRVFGDDIILPAECAEDLTEALHLTGFTVNTAKSYSRGYFRESCGMFSWRGVDITPFRFKRIEGGLFSASYSCERTDQMIEILNQLERRGFHRTRSYILSAFLNGNLNVGSRTVKASKLLVFSTTGNSGSVISTHPTNFHLSRKFNEPLQVQQLVRVGWVPNRRYNLLPKGDSLMYQEWLLSKTKASEEDLDQPCDALGYRLEVSNPPEDLKHKAKVPAFRMVTEDWVG